MIAADSDASDAVGQRALFKRKHEDQVTRVHTEAERLT